jgi:hypothetical protein
MLVHELLSSRQSIPAAHAIIMADRSIATDKPNFIKLETVPVTGPCGYGRAHFRQTTRPDRPFRDNGAFIFYSKLGNYLERIGF